VGDLRISTASAADLLTMRRWAADEGWNPGQSDVLAFAAADPGGYLVGRLDGELVASCSGVRYGADYGFLGFYLVRPDLRGQGYGIQLWQAVMSLLAGRTIGLDGVVDQQDNYRRSGFRHALTHIRYAGVPGAAAGLAEVELVDARSIPFHELAAYDRRFFPADRDAFLSLWVSLPGHTSLAALRGGRLVGFGVLRPAESGMRVGPLYAESAEIARTLLNGLASDVEVAVDVPDINRSAIELVERLGFTPVFECARMYAGPAPAVDHNGIFGTTTFELG
jgi:GNAT superfamily N-acetyltransferase